MKFHHTAQPPFIVTLCALTFIWLTAILLYPILPGEIAIHWGANGLPDDFASKQWATWIMPISATLLYAVLAWVPKIDPLKKNQAAMVPQYSKFLAIMMLFLALVHNQMLLWNVGIRIPFASTFPVLLALLMFFLARLLQHTKRNWFIGIRTPWTLSSDTVWEKTHVLSAKVLVVCSGLMLFGVVVPEYAWAFILVPILSWAVFALGYSYWVYRQEEATKSS